MPRNPRHLLFVGIKNSVIALDAKDGTAVWVTKLGGMSLVAVLWDGVELFASYKGEVCKLDPRTGAVLWHNKLKGLGVGHTIMASSRIASQSSGVEIAHAALADSEEATAG